MKRYTISMLFFLGTICFADGKKDIIPQPFTRFLMSELDANVVLKSIAVQADGKIVGAGFCLVEGKNRCAIVRYMPDGSLDQSFGVQGKVILKFGLPERSSGASSLQIQPDGKILIAGFTDAVGTYRACLARLNMNGSLDTTFLGGRGIMPGTVICDFAQQENASEFCGLLMQPDGKIVAAGTVYHPEKAVFVVARFMPSGKMDLEFGMDQRGYNCFSFDPYQRSYDRAKTLVMDPYGKLIIGGSTTALGSKNFALARITPQGKLDRSFFNSDFSRVPGTSIICFGQGETEAEITALLVQDDGKIIAGGMSNCSVCQDKSSCFSLARMDKHGYLDPQFMNDESPAAGLIITKPMNAQRSALCAMIENDNKIIVGGTTYLEDKGHITIAQYDCNGCMDYIVFDNLSQNELFCLTLTKEGTILAGGKSHEKNRNRTLLTECEMFRNPLTPPSFTSPDNNATIVPTSPVKLNGMVPHIGQIHVYLDDRHIKTVMPCHKTKKYSLELPEMEHGWHKLDVVQCRNNGCLLLKSPHSLKVYIDRNPYVADQHLSVCEGRTYCGSLFAQGGSGSYEFCINEIKNGTVKLENDQFMFTPTIPEGTARFSYEVIDKCTNGRNKAVCSFVVQPRPSAKQKEYRICRDQTVQGKLADLYDMQNIQKFILYQSCPHGEVILNEDGCFNFIPTKDFTGKTSFEYQVMDKNSLMSDPACVMICIEQPPRTTDISKEIYAGCMMHETVYDLVQGGIPPYIFVRDDSPCQGAFGMKPDGTFIYKAPNNICGTVRLPYKIVDSSGYEIESNIMMTIHQRPVANEKEFEIIQDGKLQNSLNDLVSKGVEPFSFTLIKGPEHGTLELRLDGQFIFTPNAGFVGMTDFVYHVVDSNGVPSNDATVSIIIHERPTGNPLHLVALSNQTLFGNLETNTHKGQAPYQFKLVEHSARGCTVQIKHDGAFKFVPHPDLNDLLCSFEYTVRDSRGIESDPILVSVQINELLELQPIMIELEKNSVAQGSFDSLIMDIKCPLYIRLSKDSENGTLMINPDNSYLFSPNKDFVGQALFQCTVMDQYGFNVPLDITFIVQEKSDVVDDEQTNNDDLPENVALGEQAQLDS